MAIWVVKATIRVEAETRKQAVRRAAGMLNRVTSSGGILPDEALAGSQVEIKEEAGRSIPLKAGRLGV